MSDSDGRTASPSQRDANEAPSAEPGPPVPVLDPETDVTIAFTPRQLAAGAAVIAGLVLLLAARRRRGGDRRAPDEA